MIVVFRRNLSLSFSLRFFFSSVTSCFQCSIGLLVKNNLCKRKYNSSHQCFAFVSFGGADFWILMPTRMGCISLFGGFISANSIKVMPAEIEESFSKRTNCYRVLRTTSAESNDNVTVLKRTRQQILRYTIQAVCKENLQIIFHMSLYLEVFHSLMTNEVSGRSYIKRP